MAIAEVVYYDGTEAERFEYEVRIDGNRIVLSYEDEDEDGVPIRPVWNGMEHGDGHYILRCTAVNGRSTLHRVPGENVLEGCWWEDGE